MISSQPSMPEIHTSCPLPVSWSLTGKRGRKKLQGGPEKETQEHDIARLLLMLSSPSAARGCSEVPRLCEAEPGGVGMGDWAEERGKRLRRTVAVAALHECELCSKRFRTGRALGGHMKNHSERDLKGRVVKKKMKKISALGLGLGLAPPHEYDRAPPSRSPPDDSYEAVFEERGEKEEEDGGGDSFEHGKGSSSPPAPLLLSY